MHTLVFDGDNTLWPCSEYYARARRELVERVRREFPEVQEREVLRVQDEVNTRAAHGPHAFQRDHFPGSLQEAYREIARRQGGRASPVTLAELYQVGIQVFDAPYGLYEGVPELLARYREAGCRLALLTKGDPDIQNAKLERNGARGFFERVEVVGRKEATTFQRLAESLRKGQTGRAWSVGDSLRDDIRTAQTAGLGTVWVSGRTHSWGFEQGQEEVRPDHVIARVVDLAEVLALPERESASHSR